MVKITINDEALMRVITNRVEKILTSAGSFVKSAARRNVPVDTGDLLNSIDTKQASNLEASGALIGFESVVRIGSDLHYAAYVEAGTPKMSAQPYLRPALMESLAFLKQLIREKL